MLRRRVVRQTGYHWHNFNYASTLLRMGDIAARLREFVTRIDAPAVHLIGHSMGGIAILRMLETLPALPPGRVVFLGTPAQRSYAASRVAGHVLGRLALGVAARAELTVEHGRRWMSERELGLVVGTQEFSLARIVVRFQEPNDGAVAVAETDIPGAKARVVLPVGHTSMLFSPRVAAAVGNFLATGSFSVPAAVSGTDGMT